MSCEGLALSFLLGLTAPVHTKQHQILSKAPSMSFPETDLRVLINIAQGSLSLRVTRVGARVELGLAIYKASAL